MAGEERASQDPPDEMTATIADHGWTTRTVKIAYVGGCHLSGYPIGADLAFPRLVGVELGRSGISVESEILQPVAVHHTSRIIEFVEATRPDVVVLQLGNFETSLRVRSLVRRAIGLRGLRTEGAYDPTADGGYISRPDMSYRPSVGRSIRAQTRATLHRAWLWRLVAPEQIARRMDSAARAVSAASVVPVFSLDPLPCADPVIEGYRRAVRDALPARSQAYRRVDLRPALEGGLGATSFADPFHLAAAGHRLIADGLVHLLLPG